MTSIEKKKKNQLVNGRVNFDSEMRHFNFEIDFLLPASKLTKCKRLPEDSAGLVCSLWKSCFCQQGSCPNPNPNSSADEVRDCDDRELKFSLKRQLYPTALLVDLLLNLSLKCGGVTINVPVGVFFISAQFTSPGRISPWCRLSIAWRSCKWAFWTAQAPTAPTTMWLVRDVKLT